LTVNIPLAFTGAFIGAHSVYALAVDNAGQSIGSWLGGGSWTVPGSGPPTVVSTVPASGSGSSQTFAVTVAHNNGPAAISEVSFRVNSSLSSDQDCYVTFDLVANTFSLNDAIGYPITLGTANSLVNSQCIASAATASTRVLAVAFRRDSPLWPEA